jgi:hypothetical protein
MDISRGGINQPWMSQGFRALQQSDTQIAPTKELKLILNLGSTHLGKHM